MAPFSPPVSPPTAAPLSRYEIAHDEKTVDGEEVKGNITTATESNLVADVYIKHGSRIEKDMVSLEVYGMVGAEAAGVGVPLKCEDGVKIESGTGLSSATVDDDVDKVTFDLNLTEVNTTVSDGNNILVCASIVNTQDTVQIARLEAIFNVTYTYESGVLNFTVSVDDPAAASFEDEETFTIPVTANLCDSDNLPLDAVEVRIGQG